MQTDGGVLNVREGNHSENVSATYALHSGFEPFVILTGDYRDLDFKNGNALDGWRPYWSRAGDSLGTKSTAAAKQFTYEAPGSPILTPDWVRIPAHRNCDAGGRNATGECNQE